MNEMERDLYEATRGLEITKYMLEDYWKAIERVRELHKPIEYDGRLGIYNICNHCSELAEIAYKYPCDTIKALDGEK